MAKAIYLGIDGKARKMKKAYIGIDGKARKIKKVYVGVNGKARLAYTAAKLDVTWTTGFSYDGYKNDDGKRRYKTYSTATFTLDVEPSNATIKITLDADGRYNPIYVTALTSNKTFEVCVNWDTDGYPEPTSGTSTLTITSSEGLKKTLKIVTGWSRVDYNMASSTYCITDVYLA